MEMVTLPCDVSRGEKVSVPVSDCTESPEFSHYMDNWRSDQISRSREKCALNKEKVRLE